jgi:Uma2 family endonuclease
MSAISMRIPPRPSAEPVFQLSVEQYHAMIETGVLTSDDPVELLEGVLVAKMPKNPPHTYVTNVAPEVFRAILPVGWFFQTQDPITLDDGEPEPDGAVVRGKPADYLDRHPGPADVAVLLEVADSTLARDRGIKLRSYARAGIPVYWIVNLIDRRVEVYTDPDREVLDPAYRRVEIFGIAENIPVVIAEASVGYVAVAALLPRH